MKQALQQGLTEKRLYLIEPFQLAAQEAVVTDS